MLKTKDVNSKNKKKTIVNITDIERQKCYICIEMYKKNERSPPFSKGRLQKKIPEKGHHFELCNSACVCVYCFVCARRFTFSLSLLPIRSKCACVFFFLQLQCLAAPSTGGAHPVAQFKTGVPFLYAAHEGSKIRRKKSMKNAVFFCN